MENAILPPPRAPARGDLRTAALDSPPRCGVRSDRQPPAPSALYACTIAPEYARYLDADREALALVACIASGERPWDDPIDGPVALGDPGDDVDLARVLRPKLASPRSCIRSRSAAWAALSGTLSAVRSAAMSAASVTEGRFGGSWVPLPAGEGFEALEPDLDLEATP